MNKCPRCENENLKEDYKYCPVCGLDLSFDIIEGLKSIENTCLGLTKSGRLALDLAIKDLERTAPEVPVQEQPKTLEFINKEFDINLSQKQYDDIAIFDLCTQKYTAYEILKLLKMLEII